MPVSPFRRAVESMLSTPPEAPPDVSLDQLDVIQQLIGEPNEATEVGTGHGTRVAVGADAIPGWVNIFLGAIMRGDSIFTATKVANVSSAAPYVRQKRDERFRRAFEVAMEIGARYLEHEAQRRATVGTLKPVFYKGVQCGEVCEYSDALLTLLLKKRDPSYRDNPSSLTINNSKTVNVFADIERDVKLIEGTSAAVEQEQHAGPTHWVDPAPDSRLQADGPPEPVDEAQAD